MRKSFNVKVAIAFAAACMIIAVPAMASSVHLKGGANAKPSFFDHGLSLTGSGALSGLGNQDLVVNLSAQANVRSTCTNPAGATQPPGQNPAPITVTGSQPIPANEVKNGSVSFNVSTAAPASPISGAPDCPNPQWTEAIQDLAFTSAVITVEQPPGTVVFSLPCRFSPPTSDGLVPGSNVTCG